MAQIRKLFSHEAEEVLELWKMNCLEAANAILSGSEAGRVLVILQQYASHRDAFCLVAEEQSKLVGFLTARFTTHPIQEGLGGEIEELFVIPQNRRNGIGSELVKHAVSLLRAQGASTIRIHACAESQTASGFWNSLGWEQDLVIFSLYQV